MEYLHTMVRVKDLDKSLDFYCNALGLVETRRYESEQGRFTLIFLSAPGDLDRAKTDQAPLVELTYNWDQSEPYDLGNGWGHMALEVSDVYAACEKLAEAGVNITRAPGPMKHGTRVIAFIEDPDGYKIELIQPN